MKRFGIFGWGIVAPRSPDIASFAKNLEAGESWLTAFDGFGPSTFLVGEPAFDFNDYRDWIDERFPPNKFPQLQQKMGMTTQYTIGAFIQSLQQNPGMEQTLQELGNQAHILIGTGLGEMPVQYDCSIDLYQAQRRWNRFWAAPERNSDRRRYEEAGAAERADLAATWGVPPDPRDFSDHDPDREDAGNDWFDFWMRRSDGLAEYLDAFNAIEAQGITDDVERTKLQLIRRKKAQFGKLQKKWGCPEPPWLSVSANLIWNIANTPAAQVSMLGHIKGPAYAPIAACSSFGVGLGLAMRTIQAGDAKAVVVGMSDPPPHPLSVASFYRARVLSGDRRPSAPLSDLRGTHVAGGSVVWIVGDYEFMTARGYKPLGLELLSVGVTSDAHHIITPTRHGPQEAIEIAMRSPSLNGDGFGTWDLHATATPGDYLEVETLRGVIPENLLVTARKGIFGHGMAASGGWELTAQYLGITAGKMPPTPLTSAELHPRIESAPYEYVLNEAQVAPPGLAGKLSMGIGGINACVISRRWEDGPQE
jgi:3-oxoacyl-(acyl-carrier-protein) synthase